jgi:pullulanase
MKRTVYDTTFLLTVATTTMAQSFNPDELAQGYAHRNDTTFFLFEPVLYAAEDADRIVVTGPFRGWSQDMNRSDWHLVPTNGKTSPWVLAVPNADFDAIPPSSPFKFRRDAGEWLDPPASTPNAEGGNLIFMQNHQPPQLSAELVNPKAIWITLTGENLTRPLNPSAYRLTDAQGNDLPIAQVLPHTATTLLVVPETNLNLHRVHFLELPALGLRSLCSFDGWFRTLYSTKELGANINGNQTVFRLFAPRAEQVRLYLYHEPGEQEASRIIDMQRDEDGVWEAFQDDDLHGVYYDFTVHGPADPGNQFYETHPIHLSDPYARVNVEAFGKSRVWRRTQPASPLPNGTPPMEDVVAYEVHLHDFSDILHVN